MIPKHPFEQRHQAIIVGLFSGFKFPKLKSMDEIIVGMINKTFI